MRPFSSESTCCNHQEEKQRGSGVHLCDLYWGSNSYRWTPKHHSMIHQVTVFPEKPEDSLIVFCWFLLNTLRSPTVPNSSSDLVGRQHKCFWAGKKWPQSCSTLAAGWPQHWQLATGVNSTQLPTSQQILSNPNNIHKSQISVIKEIHPTK